MSLALLALLCTSVQGSPNQFPLLTDFGLQGFEQWLPLSTLPCQFQCQSQLPIRTLVDTTLCHLGLIHRNRDAPGVCLDEVELPGLSSGTSVCPMHMEKMGYTRFFRYETQFPDSLVFHHFPILSRSLLLPLQIHHWKNLYLCPTHGQRVIFSLNSFPYTRQGQFCGCLTQVSPYTWTEQRNLVFNLA